MYGSQHMNSSCCNLNHHTNFLVYCYILQQYKNCILKSYDLLTIGIRSHKYKKGFFNESDLRLCHETSASIGFLGQ